jgi:hypothetical protein
LRIFYLLEKHLFDKLDFTASYFEATAELQMKNNGGAELGGSKSPDFNCSNDKCFLNMKHEQPLVQGLIENDVTF